MIKQAKSEVTMPVVNRKRSKASLRRVDQAADFPPGRPRSSKTLGGISPLGASVGPKSRPVLSPAQVRDGFGVKQPDFARMTGYSVRSVAGWEAGQPVSPSARQKLAEMARLRAGLADVMAPEHIGEWLNSPNDAFGGQTPLQIVERGEIDRLWRMIFQLEAGVAT
jgi:hypothetical protein